MKAVLARAYGGPEVLTLEDVDRPKPEANQVLVQVHAAATNPLLLASWLGVRTMTPDGHSRRSRRGRFLPWLWCAVTVGLLGVVVVTTVPAWLVAVWVASTGLAITRRDRT